MSIISRLDNDETCMDAIDDAIDIIVEMRIIIQCAVALNNSARLENANLWGVDSDFQDRIDKVLAEVEK